MSSEPILPGDLVMMVNATYFEEWNGTIAVVDRPLGLQCGVLNLHTLERHSFHGYRVILGDGRPVRVTPDQIIPIKPRLSGEQDEAAPEIPLDAIND